MLPSKEAGSWTPAQPPRPPLSPSAPERMPGPKTFLMAQMFHCSNGELNSLKPK